MKYNGTREGKWLKELWNDNKEMGELREKLRKFRSCLTQSPLCGYMDMSSGLLEQQEEFYLTLRTTEYMIMKNIQKTKMSKYMLNNDYKVQCGKNVIGRQV